MCICQITIGFLKPFIAHFRILKNTINMTIILDSLNHIVKLSQWVYAMRPSQDTTHINVKLVSVCPYQLSTKKAIIWEDSIVPSNILFSQTHSGRWSCSVIRYKEGEVPIQLGPSEWVNLYYWNIGLFLIGPSGNLSFLPHNGKRWSFWNVFKRNPRWWATSKITDTFVLTRHHQKYWDPRIQSLSLPGLLFLATCAIKASKHQFLQNILRFHHVPTEN
jgi:hypothetical protein